MDTKQPQALVSIGVPVYNCETWLAQALESMLGQTYGALEMVISDNASTDATGEICRSYAARDARIRYVLQPKNIGAAGNYNAVFLKSRGKYFKWASANDYCDNNLVAECVKLLEVRDDVALCYGRTRLIQDNEGRWEDYEDNLDLQQQDPAVRLCELLRRMRLNNAMNGLFRVTVLRQTSLVRPHLGSDIPLMVEVALRGKIVQIQNAFFWRRMHRGATTNRMTPAEVAAFYAPQRQRPLTLQTWKLHGAYLSAAMRVPLSYAGKARALAHLARRMWWDRRHLVKELRPVVGAVSGAKHDMRPAGTHGGNE